MDARDEILALAEMIDAPVVAFRSGRGIVSNAHELGLTMAAGYQLWPTTDLMIGIGSRMELPSLWFRWPFQPDGLKSGPYRHRPVEMRRLTSTPPWSPTRRPVPRDLIAALRKAGYRRPAAAARRSARPTRRHSGDPEVQPHMAYLNILREVLPETPRHRGAVAGRLHLLVRLPVYEPRTFITSGYQGTLGSGFPDRARRQGRALPIGRWSRSPAMAASCSACRSSRRPCSSGSAW